MLTDEQLGEIKARVEHARFRSSPWSFSYACDVPDLLAEIDRLRAERDALRKHVIHRYVRGSLHQRNSEYFYVTQCRECGKEASLLCGTSAYGLFNFPPAESEQYPPEQHHAGCFLAASAPSGVQPGPLVGGDPTMGGV